MVCPRCIKVVQEEFEKLNIPVQHNELGKVTTDKELHSELIESIEKVGRRRISLKATWR